MSRLRALLLLLACVALAHANPVLEFLAPAGGQRGTQVEVTILGSGLADVKAIVFYEPGITVVDWVERADKSLRVRLKLDPDCRLGPHLLRLFGRDQFSKIIVFAVGQFPERTAGGKNQDFASAEPVTMNQTINGVLPKEAIDHYSITLKKDELLSAEVEANRLAYGFFDAQLTLFDEQHKVLIESDDTFQLGLDPYISFRAPRAGTYFLAVRNSEYDGHANARYRLHVGAYPRPDAIYPGGGQAGSEQEVTYVLADGGTLKAKIRVPELAKELEWQQVEFHPQLAGISTPSGVPFQVSRYPCFAEQGDNDTRESVTAFPPVPVIFDGRFEKPLDQDWFGFTAKKGDKLTVTVFGRALCAPTDAFLRVHDMAEQDDHNGADPEVDVTVPSDGRHYIQVFETLKNWGPAYVYRIAVVPTVPRIRLELTSTSGCEEAGQALMIPRGGRTFRLFQVNRRGTSGKDVIDFGKLPAGVSFQVLPYPENATDVPVVFAATEAAADTYFQAQPAITSGEGVKGGFSQRFDINHGDNCRSYFHPVFTSLTLGVAEKPPFRLRFAAHALPLPRLGKHEVPIIVERDPGFSEAVEVRLVHKHGDMSALDRVVVAKDQTTATYAIEASAQVPDGEWPLVFTATAHSAGMLYEVTGEPQRVTVIGNFLGVKFATQAVKPGANGTVTIQLEQLKPFTGNATGRLVGLPDGVTAKSVSVTSATKQLTCELAVAADAKVGTYRNLALEVAIPWEGQLLPQTVYLDGALRIDDSGPETGASGK